PATRTPKPMSSRAVKEVRGLVKGRMVGFLMLGQDDFALVRAGLFGEHLAIRPHLLAQGVLQAQAILARVSAGGTAVAGRSALKCEIWIVFYCHGGIVGFVRLPHRGRAALMRAAERRGLERIIEP